MRKLLIAALLAVLWAGTAQAQGLGPGIQYTPDPMQQGTVRPIVNKTVDVATGGTAQETLYTLTIPANTFDKVGTMVRVVATATPVNNANAKSLALRDTGTTGTSTCTTSTANYCVLDVTLMRVNANTYTTIVPAGSYAAATPRDFTAAMTWLVQGTTPTSAADLTLRQVTVYVIKAVAVSSLSLGFSGTDAIVESANQQWTLKQWPGGPGDGDWSIYSQKVKGANKAWVQALTNPGQNNTVAYRNGEFLGGTHLNMGTPVATWKMDGIPFTPSTNPGFGTTLELTQTVTGSLGGVPTLAATFRHDMVG
jgi:hypothetical protein